MTTGLIRDNSILSANVTGASQLALGLNSNRQMLFIQNNQTGNIGVTMATDNAGESASLTGSGVIILTPGATVTAGLTGHYCPQNAVNVIGTANAGNITVLEG